MVNVALAVGRLAIWYLGLVYVATLIGLFVCIWIYTSSNQKGVGATWPLALAVVGTVLILPSCLIALGLVGTDVIMAANMCYIGILGLVAVLLAALLYAMGIAVAQPYQPPPQTYRETARSAPVASAAPAPRPRPTERTRFVGEQAPPAAWLVPKAGSRAGQQMGLARGSNLIGRGHKSNLVMEDPSVSGEHARIQYENGQFVIYDLASLNGTFVNGQRAQKQLLMDGDEIKLGETVLVFKKV